jgi:hypothetical protein
MFINEIDYRLKNEVFEKVSQEDYRSATFGRSIIQAANIIHETTVDEDRNWQIVPADFFKPMFIDKHLHKLVSMFKTVDDIKLRSVNPRVFKHEIIKPEVNYRYLDYQMTVK